VDPDEIAKNDQDYPGGEEPRSQKVLLPSPWY
jgi:hypothetical protein